MPAAHAFRLVVFDVDGTLVDSQAGIAAAMAEAFAEAGLAPPSREVVRRVVGLSLETAVARLLAAPEPAAVRRISEAYRRAFAALCAHPDYREPLFEGAREALAALDEPGVSLGVATGKGRRGVSAVLERHGLAERFVTVQTADDGPGKPHPDMLRRAMAEVDAAPHETVLVGDTTYDIEMAAAAGSAAVGVAWGCHAPAELVAVGAAGVVDSFAELPPALARLGREYA